MAKTEKDLKVKTYKLGDGATNFVDVSTKKKISGESHVDFTLAERKTQRFKTALKHGHIVEVDEDEEEEETELSEREIAMKNFAALKLEDAKKFIKDEYELEEDEEKVIDAITKKADAFTAYSKLYDAIEG